MTTTSTITNRTAKYESVKKIKSSNILNLDDKLAEETKIKLLKHKKCKVILLVKDQIELLKKRETELDLHCVESKTKMWWNLQKNNFLKFLVASSVLLFLWSTLVLLGAAICNLYNADCTCYNNFWFLPWFASKKEHHLLF